jgi:hypothetical protein
VPIDRIGGHSPPYSSTLYFAETGMKKPQTYPGLFAMRLLIDLTPSE